VSLRSTLKYISLASLLTTAAAEKAQTIRSEGQVFDERFTDFVTRVAGQKGSVAKKSAVHAFVEKVRSRGRPVIEDSTVYFMYYGIARRVNVPSDLNGWSLAVDTMKRIDGTDLFYLAKSVDEAARFEYKLVVDSTWILDPLNQQQAFGGFGPNSEIWMPQYSPPREIGCRSKISEGTVDTLNFKSRLLGRTHPVFIYVPSGYKNSRSTYPCIYVTDGGEYISLALMLNVLDNLIADKRIQPVVGIFIDPRTDPRNAQTSMRMLDYSMSDTFVNALLTELRPRLMKKYKLTTKPDQTAIMGASLGGLISTYAAYKHPEVFGLCAAQSPAYWWKDDAIIKMIESAPQKQIKFYIDTGTILDAREKAHKMKLILESKGYQVLYSEHPEGHNWVNWRARLAKILTHFWGVK
jgi:enterochelin esterase-like enzyme